jgi:hypothetical protein
METPSRGADQREALKNAAFLKPDWMIEKCYKQQGIF